MNRKAAEDPAKRQKAESLVLMLQGAIAAATRVGLMLNVKQQDLAARTGSAPGAEKSHHFRAQRFGMGPRQHHRRRGRRPADSSKAQGCQGPGHCGISLEQESCSDENPETHRAKPKQNSCGSVRAMTALPLQTAAKIVADVRLRGDAALHKWNRSSIRPRRNTRSSGSLPPKPTRQRNVSAANSFALSLTPRTMFAAWREKQLPPRMVAPG